MRHEFNIKIRRPAEKSVFNAIIGEKFFNTVITELKQFNIMTSGLKVLSRFGVLNNKIKSVQNIVTRIKMRFGTFRNDIVSTQELVLSVARNLTPIFTDENIKIKSSQYFAHLMYMLRIKADNIFTGAQNLVVRMKMRMPMSTGTVVKHDLISRLKIYNTGYSNIKSSQSINLKISELRKLGYWDDYILQNIDSLSLEDMESEPIE